MKLNPDEHSLFLCVLTIIVLGACSAPKDVQKIETPYWLKQRPVSMTHYVGIGSARPNSTPGEAMKTAKERAIADLAAEISVSVESASLLETADINGRIQKEFSRRISSRSEELVVGFEVVDTWEGDPEGAAPEGVYVYYRLSKAKHAEARAERKATAIESALAELRAGLDSRQSANLLGALEHWNAGVVALEEFWNEPNKGEFEGHTITLGPHLVRQMRNAIRDLEISSSMQRVVLNAGNDFKFPLGVQATLDGSWAGGVPIHYEYFNGTYTKRATEFTDQEGTIVALIGGLSQGIPQQRITAHLNIDRLLDEAGVDEIIKEMIGEITPYKLFLPLTVEMPTVRMEVAASSEVSVNDHDGLIQAMRGLLLEAGYTIVEADRADISITFDLRHEARTPTTEYGNFHTAYIEGAISIRRPSGQMIHEERIDRIKGVQLNPNAALQVALNNAADAIEKRIGKSLMEKLN